MKLLIKEAGVETGGRVLGGAQVQLLKESIEGMPEQRTKKVWSLLSLPGINMVEEIDQYGAGKRQGTRFVLEYAQV